MEPIITKKGRPPRKKAVEKPDQVAHLAQEVHALMTNHAKKLKVSNSKYASAAIAFFAESGLDPTAERPAGLAHLGEKVADETKMVRKQNTEIGNRLIGLLRTWEKNQYVFLQQQQQGMLNYLEQIENNIIRHQVAIETSFLSPLVELVIRGNQESYITRLLAEEIQLKVMGKTENTFEAMHLHYTAQRDDKVVTQVRAFLQANGVAAPGRAPKPVVPEIPKVVPSSATVVVPAAGATPK